MLIQQLLAWSWLFTVPGLLLSALTPGRFRAAIGWASIAGPLLLLLLAGAALVGGTTGYALELPGWLPFLPDPSFRVLVDGLSETLLAILGLVATLVYVYSIGYMEGHAGKRRFFVFLDLFVAAMTLLVLAGNLEVLLIGWTGVGISSFLLISFYQDRPGTLSAGLQALAANAIGDAALLLAAALLPVGCGALVTLGTTQCASGPGGPTLIAWLIFLAAAAKSAQGPLYFWLPSAMAGPTPISALVHAATMVAAGVYLLARTHALTAQAESVALSIAVIGVATAIGASVASLFQPNFKRGIAYSTVAQLGYMFAALGLGGPFAAVFHLFTHAAFKALLFLSAGVVIHGSNGEEQLARLSGRGRHFPVSHAGFLVGSLALIGTPLVTAGAFSKDAIIDAALSSGYPIFGYALTVSVLLTGLYIGRLYFRVYHGAPSPASQPEPHPSAHPGASERWMSWALLPLILASLLAGYLGTSAGWLQQILAPAVGEAASVQPITLTGVTAFGLGLIGFAVMFVRERGSPAVVRPPATGGPYSAPWIHAIARAGYGASAVLLRAQSGLLPRYLFASILALGVITLLRVVLG